MRDERGGGFVVQERIFAARRPATRITPEGVDPRESCTATSPPTAASAPRVPDGSVVRAAASPVVNILGGGGLAPVVPEDVYERLR